VMLDGGLACKQLGDEWRIWWGANLSTASEQLVSGALDDVIDDIVLAREQAKAGSGWVMDIYLLRRTPKRESGT
jgi:precorrin-6A synthase